MPEPAFAGASPAMTIPDLPSRYSVRSLLGEGGSGRVYRAHDSIRDRELALKLVTPAESAFLRREFDTLRQIRHENLIQVFDWGALPSGESYYTMELIDGGDWASRMCAAQPADEVRRILTGLLRGLAHLHCHGEIHGDLKPGNILLGAGGVVKITDTGMGGSREGTGPVGPPDRLDQGGGSGKSGTPGYAAPEIWEGARADVRSDVYSVGVMAYEALAGRHPFAGKTVREVVSGQLEGWVPSPGAHGVPVPADLERVVMRALERQPGLRQGSADEFMEGMGVEDRIGEILGGKLVGREKEIAEIEALLWAKESGTPTLVHVVGEPGIGKTAILDELMHRLPASGARVFRVGRRDLHPEHFRRALGMGTSPPSTGESGEITALSEAIHSSSNESPLFVWLDADGDGASDSFIRPLARYVWALSIERGCPGRVVFALTVGRPSSSFEKFERRLEIPSHSVEGVRLWTEGLLGRLSIEDELFMRLHELTGGNPGALRSSVTALIDKGLLDRRGGTWILRETERVRNLELPAEANPWIASWDHLTLAEKKAVITLSLLRGGAPVQNGFPLAPRDVVSGLESKGWVRRDQLKWSVASESIRDAALRRAPSELRDAVAAALLASTNGVIDREERADLELAGQPSAQAVREGLWAADQAIQRGDNRAAVVRLRACLDMTRTLGSSQEAMRIALKLAQVLHSVGEESEALDCIEKNRASLGDTANHPEAARMERLLGEINRSLGRNEEAREHLEKAAQLSESAGDAKTLLASQTALAEIDWRHGSEAARADAIARMRALLSRTSAADPDDVANLTYQVGAALIIAGRFQEATETLSQTVGRKCSDNWRMRIANALASSNFYLGRFEEALRWVNEAWRIAERAGLDSYKPRILANRGSIYNGLGCPRDAVNEQLLGAKWARRTGDFSEYSFACAGASFNLTLLARYEDAIEKARESHEVAEVIDEADFIAKALELEALALFHIGDYESSRSRIRSAEELVAEKGYLSVKPRMDWLRARIAIAEEDLNGARERLDAAEEVLRRTEDWEDLPGVQIEKYLLRARENHTEALRGIWDIAREPRNSGALIVQLYAAVGIAEILLEYGADEIDFGDFLVRALERAEEAGMLETVWRLSYAIGEFCARDGDSRAAQSRFGLAVRALREIASSLKPPHRVTYLHRPHTRSAISRLLPDS